MTITAKIGFGPMVKGEVAVMANLGTQDLTFALENKILVAVKWVPKEFLEKASFVGAAGVVVPSIHFRDYEYFQKRGGLTMLVLDRFGGEDLPDEVLEKLSKLDGKQASLDGEQKRLEI